LLCCLFLKSIIIRDIFHKEREKKPPIFLKDVYFLIYCILCYCPPRIKSKKVEKEPLNFIFICVRIYTQ
jgi:hypothetical protein